MSPRAIAAGSVGVYPPQALQLIDGWGARLSDTSMTTALADQFFTTGAGGIGLTHAFLSIEIDFVDGYPYNTGVHDLYTQATQAGDRGAKLWGVPYTALAAQKDNSSLVNGGHLLAASRDAYATTLAAFPAAFKTGTGYDLAGFELQNEPDFSASYSSMLYTAAEMTAFVKVLGPKLAALSPVPALVLGSPANWNNLAALITDTMGDSVAAPYISYFGAHQYSGAVAPTSLAKRTWQTEMSDAGAPSAFDTTMTSGLTTAQWIHDGLTTGQASLWNYFWTLGQALNDNEGLIGQNGDTQQTKRVWVMGNWSKFVRPGFYRVSTSGSVAGVNLTAFVNPATNAFVIVAVNTNAGSATLPVAVFGTSVSAVTPWTTSATLNLVQQGTIGLVDGVFAATLPASSVTSFVSV